MVNSNSGARFEARENAHAADARMPRPLPEPARGADRAPFLRVQMRDPASWPYTYTPGRLLDVSDRGRSVLEGWGMVVGGPLAVATFPATGQGALVTLPPLPRGQRVKVFVVIEESGCPHRGPEMEFVAGEADASGDPRDREVRDRAVLLPSLARGQRAKVYLEIEESGSPHREPEVELVLLDAGGDMGLGTGSLVSKGDSMPRVSESGEHTLTAIAGSNVVTVPEPVGTPIAGPATAIAPQLMAAPSTQTVDATERAHRTT